MKSTGTMLAAIGVLGLGLAMPALGGGKGYSVSIRVGGGDYYARSGYHNRAVAYRNAYCAPRAYSRATHHRGAYAQPVVFVNHRAPGYYVNQPRRVWVPGAWVYEPIGWGSYKKVWRPACYQTVMTPVWVGGYSRR